MVSLTMPRVGGSRAREASERKKRKKRSASQLGARKIGREIGNRAKVSDEREENMVKVTKLVRIGN